MKNKFYGFLELIKLKIEKYLIDEGYYDDVLTRFDSDFWSDYE